MLPPRIRLILQAEGAVLAALAIWLYAGTEGGWLLFAVLILAPDLAMAGYLRGPALGAHLYNAAHTTLGPAILFAVGWLAGWEWTLPVALIWAAHIGIDRAIGYGLKDVTAFKRTHLTP